jgi:nicotinic acid mononucleotide adenylyltransferase
MLFGPKYENVAWMGGSYAPPTRMHVQVAMQMGAALLEKTTPGKRCAVCIVPVNKNYNKRSVKEACISDAVRRALIMAFVDAVKLEFASHPRAKDCDFLYMEYELNASAPVPTIDSLGMLKSALPGATNYYIAQGQDNILAIMRRTWVRSDELLRDYSFFMYPRGDVRGLPEQMMDAMMDPTSSTKGIAPLSEAAAEAVLGKVLYVGAGFNDDTSSSQVRRDLRDGNIGAVRAAMHPDVFALMASMATTGTGAWPYSSAECDDASASAGGGGGAGGSFRATYGGRRRGRGSKKMHRSKRRSMRRIRR